MAASEGGNGARRHILLVDDVELNRVLASAVLGSALYDVDCVSDGPSAFAAVEGAAYDLVLLNLGVPGLDTVVAACREKGADTPKLASLSVRQLHDRREETIAALDAHIVRPTVPADLIRAVDRVLAAPVVWRREAYADLVKQLGAARMNELLVEFLALCTSMAETIGHAGASEAEIDRQAHDLASVSGMFGFDAVSQGCFAVLREAERRQALHDLVEALRRANAMIGARSGPKRSPSRPERPGGTKDDVACDTFHVMVLRLRGRRERRHHRRSGEPPPNAARAQDDDSPRRGRDPGVDRGNDAVFAPGTRVRPAGRDAPRVRDPAERIADQCGRRARRIGPAGLYPHVRSQISGLVHDRLGANRDRGRLVEGLARG